MSSHYPPPETAGFHQQYNSNISIPGAVLFSAFVVFFIILFLLACCCAARFSTLRRQLADAADAATEDTGLRPDIVKSLPTFFYNSSSSSSSAADGRNKLECAVCLEEFKEGEEGRRLPGCKHSFHVECIGMWLSSHSTCPICRSIVKAEDIRKDALDLVIRT